jgi:hypothetical protein
MEAAMHAWRWPLVRLLSIGLAVAVLMLFAHGATGQERVTVTVDQVVKQKHRLEVMAGSEVVFGDPHFANVGFPTVTDDPKIAREAGRLRVTFAKPGTYRGAFTVAGGHGTSDVYHIVVVVKPRSP